MHSKVSLVISVFVAALVVRAASQEKNEIGDILDGLFKETYDKRIRPNYGGPPLQVEMNCYILDVFDVKEENHEFSVNMYFRHHWIDPRLVYKPLPGMEHIAIDADHASKMWSPDTFISNERKAIRHSVGPIQEMVRIKPDGNIMKSARLTVTGSCKMSLGYFPFDRQLCALDIESYQHTAADIIYSWKGPPGVSKEASSLTFKITGVNIRSEFESVASGNYSRLGLEFFFVRNSIRYLQDIYFPTFCLVVIAVLTLYTGSLMARIQLSVAVMIGMVVVMLLNSAWMPKVSYQTALDIYLFICATHIFNIVIVNFLMYNFYKPNETRPQGIRMRQLNDNDFERANGGVAANDDMKEYLHDGGEAFGPKLDSRLDEILYSICKKSKYTVPISFVVINLIYWVVVAVGSSWFPEDFLIVEVRE